MESHLTIRVAAYATVVKQLAVDHLKQHGNPQRTAKRQWDEVWPSGPDPGRQSAEHRRLSRRRFTAAMAEGLEPIGEVLEGVVEELLFTAEAEHKGARMMVYASQGEDGQWACPLTREEGDGDFPWLNVRGSPSEWAAQRTVAVGGHRDEWTSSGQPEQCEVEGTAVYVRRPEMVGDWRVEPCATAAQEALARDPLRLKDHRARWVPVEELLSPQAEWVSPRQGARLRWLAAEAGAWLGRDKNTPLMETQRERVQRELDLYGRADDGLKEKYARITGTVAQATVLPGSARRATVVPVTVGFVDYMGKSVPLPKVGGTGGQGRHAVVPCQVTCAARGLITPYGLAPPGAKLITLHVTNHSGRRQHLMQGESLCCIEGVRRLAEGQDRSVSPATKKWLDELGVPTAGLCHATDLVGPWSDRRVLVNHSICFGGAQGQDRACRWVEAHDPMGTVLLQVVTDVTALKPWKDAGYRVERAPGGCTGYGEKHSTMGFMDLHETTKGPWWKRGSGPEGELWVIWREKTVEESATVMALRAEEEDAVMERRRSLIQQRKELTGDEGHQFPEGSERTKAVDAMFEPYMPLFDPDNLGQTEGAHCEIDTGDAEPVVNQPYRLSPNERDIIRTEVSKMLKMGVVRPSQSPWGSLPVLARKPDGSVRFCIDYRAVNKVTKPDAMPIPRIDDTLAALQGARYFTTMDAMSGFWQVPVREDHIEKTAFLTVEGSYEFVRMPFGLRNAPACFQRLMNRVLAGLTWKTCLIYIDDCTIYSGTFEQHLLDVAEVLERFKGAGVTLKMSKCRFFVSVMDFLGHVVSGEGIKPSPKKVAAIQEVKLPTNISELRGFLGLTGWFRKFVKDYARIALPLTQLTKKENRKKIREEMQTPECRKAVQQLKDALAGEDVMLIHPNFEKKFRVDLDASENQIGGVLLQHDEEMDAWRPIEFLSKKFTRELKDQGFAPTHLEALALQACVDRWRPYLIDRCFDLVTDHTALKSLPTRKMDQNMLTRHQLLMQPYNYNIVYRPGSIHHVPDGLSRLPREENPDGELPLEDYGDKIPSLEARQLLKGEPEKLPGGAAAAAVCAVREARVVVMCVVTDQGSDLSVMAGRVTRSQTLGNRELEAEAVEADPTPSASLPTVPTTCEDVDEEHDPRDHEGMELFDMWVSEVDVVPVEWGLNDEQSALLLSLQFDGWRDLRENLQCTMEQVKRIKEGVEKYQAEIEECSAQETPLFTTDLQEELDVEFLNQLTEQKSPAIQELLISGRVKKKVLETNFDDWDDLREATGCTEEELTTIRESVERLRGQQQKEDAKTSQEIDKTPIPPGFVKAHVQYGTPQNPGLDVPDDERLAQMQKQDNHLLSIIEYCKNPREAKHPQQFGGEKPMLLGQLGQFALGDRYDLLLRSDYSVPGRAERRREQEAWEQDGLMALRHRIVSPLNYQRVIPEGGLREVLLYYYHGHRLHLHMGVENTLAQMRKAVWWPGMREDVTNYHASCICMKTGRYPNGVGARVRLVAPKGRLRSDLTAPHQLLYMDHKSLPPTKEGYKAVLIMVDGFSNFVQLAPQKTLTAEETSRAVVDRWLQPFGHTEEIHADGAPSFTGEVVTAVNRCMGVRQSRIIPHNPRGNALAEGTVRRVKVALTNLVTRAPREWPMFLPFVALVLNDTVNPETAVAPIMAHLGKLPQGRTTIEIPYSCLMQQEQEETSGGSASARPRETPPQYAKRWTLRIQGVLQGVCKQLAADRHELLNQRAKTLDERGQVLQAELPEPGDLVYYWNEMIHSRIQSEKQLYDPWAGPYRVKRLLHGGTVVVIQVGDEERLTHPRQLRKYMGPMCGSYPTAGSGYIWGRPVEVLTHRRRGEEDEFLTRYLNQYTEVQEWTTWQLLTPRLIQTYLNDVELNRHKAKLKRGVKAAVWWPAQRRSKWGVIALREKGSNLLTIQYDDGDWGYAYVNMNGRILTAEETSFDPNTDRVKPRGIRTARKEIVPPAEQPNRKRRMGYQLAESLPY